LIWTTQALPIVLIVIQPGFRAEPSSYFVMQQCLTTFRSWLKTVLSMSGASPGGVAVLAVVPEHDFAFAAFGNDPRAMQLHDKLLLTLLHDRLGVQPQELSADEHQAVDLAPYAGTYRSNQLRIDVRVVDGGLEEMTTYEPLDDQQARIFAGFAGATFPLPPRRFLPVGQNLFAPAYCHL